MAGIGAAHGRGTAEHAGQILQGGVDLAEFDAPTAHLHLIVRAALEHEPRAFQPNQVTAAVGPFPAECRHGRILFGVLRGVEVAGEADAADHEFADRTLGDAFTLAVDDGEVPAVEGEADADRAAFHQRRARDHRRLGGAVGVPHLAIGCGESLGEFGRHRLAPEDQQADVLERLRGPHRGERRDRRDDVDLAGDKPRTEVDAAAHQRPRSRHQARAVPPGQPHFFAGGVERHRQARENPILGSDRIVLQKHSRLGVDECGRAAVADGDALRGAGGSGGEDHPGVVVEGGSAASPPGGVHPCA